MIIECSKQLQWLLVQRRHLFAQGQNVVAPVTFGAEPGEAVRKCRVIPAARQPGAVVHQAQGAQRLDQGEFARVEIVEFVVAVHQL